MATQSAATIFATPRLPRHLRRPRSPALSERASDGSLDPGAKADMLSDTDPAAPYGSPLHNLSADAADDLDSVDWGESERELSLGTGTVSPLTSNNLRHVQEELDSPVTSEETTEPDTPSPHENNNTALHAPPNLSDPLKWTNLHARFQRQQSLMPSSSVRMRNLAFRQLAAPLHRGGRLPSLVEAKRLINAQLAAENTRAYSEDAIDENSHRAANRADARRAERKYFGSSLPPLNYSSLDHWSGDDVATTAMIPAAQMEKAGFGREIPAEMLDFEFERDAHMLGTDDGAGSVDESEDEVEDLFFFGETNALRAGLGEQIERDLGLKKRREEQGRDAGVGDGGWVGGKGIYGAAVPAEVRFALPVAREEDLEAARGMCPSIRVGGTCAVLT